MIWILIALAITVVFGIAAYLFDDYDWAEYTASCFFFTMIVAVILMVGSTFFASSGAEHKVSTYPLVQLNDGNHLKGSFFLGSGVIDDRMGYNYYERHPDGSMTLESVDARDAKVIEQPGDARVVEDLKCNWRGGSIRSIPFVHFLDCEGLQETVSWTFYVPPGSVLNNYTLNAE